MKTKGHIMKIFVCFCFLFYPNCFAKLDTDWWKHTIIYELIPHTFKDSDGDGIGDFKGLSSKMDHFVDLGVEMIHLTPCFETSSKDMGYDITNYYKVDPRLGTMADFDELIRELNKRNLKLLLDLVINHSGYEHEWFQKSIDRIDPYTDFYVWKDPKGFDKKTQKPIPPNKWWSYFTRHVPGTGWTWNEKRQQFYFHHFLPEQPDFNLSNEILKEELKKMIAFWLDKGVAGFRLDATPDYFEDKEFRDDNIISQEFDQPETFEFIHEFRAFLDKYSREQGDFERIFIAEAHTYDHIVIKYYGTEDYPVTHFPYKFVLKYIDFPVYSGLLDRLLNNWIKKLPKGAVSAWMTQDHDGPRTGSRIVPEYSDIFTILSMMLPGTVGVYYGQEIGMLDGFITDDQIKDYSGFGTRDPNRLAMQWDDTINAGFSSSATPYLPTNSDYFVRNVENQKSQPISHYNLFKDLSELRKSDIFKKGQYMSYTAIAHKNDQYIMKRSYEGDELAILINFGHTSSSFNLTDIFPYFSNHSRVVAASVNSGYLKGFRVEDEMQDQFSMRPLSALVMLSTN